MEDEIKKRQKIKLFVTQFLLPQPLDLISYFFISLLALVVGSNRTLLTILSGDAPVTEMGLNGVFSERLNSANIILGDPILGRIVLFLFWLAIGSVVYMAVWIIQNLAVEVYDDITTAKLRTLGKPVPAKDEGAEAESWWGTTLAHTLFIGSSVILFMFFLVVVANVLYPAWLQLFEIGLQSIMELSGILKLIFSIIGTMITVHIFVLFWKLFFRLKGYLYNAV